MEIPERLVLHPTAHPVPRIHRAGFPLEHPYLEHCWGPTLGPTGVVLLRRAAWLWREQAPAVIPASNFARMVGVGPGTGTQSALSQTLDRLEQFGFVEPSPKAGHLLVYTEMPPRVDRHLRRLPAETRRVHDALLGEHLEQLTRKADVLTGTGAAERMSRRLDRLEHAPPSLDISLGR